jgi:hypothetical protein
MAPSGVWACVRERRETRMSVDVRIFAVVVVVKIDVVSYRLRGMVCSIAVPRYGVFNAYQFSSLMIYRRSRVSRSSIVSSLCARRRLLNQPSRLDHQRFNCNPSLSSPFPRRKISECSTVSARSTFRFPFAGCFRWVDISYPMPGIQACFDVVSAGVIVPSAVSIEITVWMPSHICVELRIQKQNETSVR